MLAIAAVVTFVLTAVLSMVGVKLRSAMATALLLNAIAMSIVSYRRIIALVLLAVAIKTA